MKTTVVIVGRGVAASVLSFLLNKAGVSHVVLDRKSQAKPFPLGETLPPTALPLLKRLGLLAVFESCAIRKTFGYHSCWGSDQLSDTHFYFSRPYQYGLKLDKQALLKRLAENTKVVQSYDHHFVVNLHEEQVEVLYAIDGERKKLNANTIVDATGRNRAVLKQLGVTIENYDHNTAFSCHLPKRKPTKLKHDVLVESFETGWGLVSGLNDKQQIVSLFSRPASSAFKAMKDYQNWPALLKNTVYLKDCLTADAAVKVRGGLANSSMPQKVGDHRWLAIGDAALAFDPLSSHGITNAIYTAWKALEEIKASDGNFSDYSKNMSAIYETYLDSKTKLYKRENRWRHSAYWKGCQLEREKVV